MVETLQVHWCKNEKETTKKITSRQSPSEKHFKLTLHTQPSAKKCFRHLTEDKLENCILNTGLRTKSPAKQQWLGSRVPTRSVVPPPRIGTSLGLLAKQS